MSAGTGRIAERSQVDNMAWGDERMELGRGGLDRGPVTGAIVDEMNGESYNALTNDRHRAGMFQLKTNAQGLTKSENKISVGRELPRKA